LHLVFIQNKLLNIFPPFCCFRPA